MKYICDFCKREFLNNGNRRKGGRPKVKQYKVESGIKLYFAGEHKMSEISKITGVSESTLRRRIRSLGNG